MDRNNPNINYKSRMDNQDDMGNFEPSLGPGMIDEAGLTGNFLNPGSQDTFSATHNYIPGQQNAFIPAALQSTSSSTQSSFWDDPTTTTPTTNYSSAPARSSRNPRGRAMLSAYALRPAHGTPSQAMAAQNIHHAGGQPNTIHAHDQGGRAHGMNTRSSTTGANLRNTISHLPRGPGSPLGGAVDFNDPGSGLPFPAMDPSPYIPNMLATDSSQYTQPAMDPNQDMQPKHTGEPSASTSTDFVRPEHFTLDHSRISRPGPELHPDPHWRAPGTHQWPSFLHDHTLLRFLSSSSIKDITTHCEKLFNPDEKKNKRARKRKTSAGSTKGKAAAAAPADGPQLVEAGPYDTSDVTAVWHYCQAYLKRRGQVNNNRAASRSRSLKAAREKHYRALCIAAGYEDVDVEIDLDDPGNDPAVEQLAKVTQETIARFHDAQAARGIAPVNTPASIQVFDQVDVSHMDAASPASMDRGMFMGTPGLSAAQTDFDAEYPFYEFQGEAPGHQQQGYMQPTALDPQLSYQGPMAQTQPVRVTRCGHTRDATVSVPRRSSMASQQYSMAPVPDAPMFSFDPSGSDPWANEFSQDVIEAFSGVQDGDYTQERNNGLP